MTETVPKITIIPANPEVKGRVVKRQLRVAAYCRVSTDDEEQLTSYSAQVDYYTNYIKSRDDWEFVSVYTDEGITGTNTKHREGFKRMVADALAGNIDLIVTQSVSRFARNTVDSLTTVRQLKEKGVEIDFEKDGLELYVDGDFLKAKEFQQKRDDPDFVKSQRDDLLSMETGILKNKGRVHFTLTSPINDQLAKLDPNMEKNELIAAIASKIDKEIYKHYRFYPCNYVAYDLLTGTRRFSEHYGLKDKKQFEDYLQGQLDKIV